MNTFIEITKEAFDVLLGDQIQVPLVLTGNVEVGCYRAHGVILKAVTNYYSKAITQYYIQDINA
jgi:hypothetical protein